MGRHLSIESTKFEKQSSSAFDEAVGILDKCAYEKFLNFRIDCDRCPVLDQCIDFWFDYGSNLGTNNPKYTLDGFKARFLAIKYSKHSKRPLDNPLDNLDIRLSSHKSQIQ